MQTKCTFINIFFVFQNKNTKGTLICKLASCSSLVCHCATSLRGKMTEHDHSTMIRSFSNFPTTLELEYTSLWN